MVGGGCSQHGGSRRGLQLLQQEPLSGDWLSLINPEEKSWDTRHLADSKENVLLTGFCSVWGLLMKGQGRRWIMAPKSPKNCLSVWACTYTSLTCKEHNQCQPEGNLIFYLKHFIFIYLAVPVLSCSMWTLTCGMWDLVLWPGIEPKPPALGDWSLSHWIKSHKGSFRVPYQWSNGTSVFHLGKLIRCSEPLSSPSQMGILGVHLIGLYWELKCGNIFKHSSILSRAYSYD